MDNEQIKNNVADSVPNFTPPTGDGKSDAIPTFTPPTPTLHRPRIQSLTLTVLLALTTKTNLL